MSVVITDQVLQNAAMSEAQFRLELAVFLFEKQIFTLGKAAETAEVPQFQLQQELAKRQIPMSYDLEEYESDLDTLSQMQQAS